MKSGNDFKKIYEKELQLLGKIKAITADKSISKELLLKELDQMGDAYDRLLRNVIKITRIGDANQRKLMRSWKLEQEKLQLEEIVRERTKELAEKNKQLQELSELKSRFFANISHEFRTPLTLIMGPLEQMVNESDRSERSHRKLKLMLRNSQRLLTLINQLLELSKFESGKVKLNAAPMDIVPFLRGTLASFELLAAQNDVELSLQLPGNEDEIELYFDPEKLEEILYNLIINAIKFTPPGGRVTISISRDNRRNQPFPNGSLCLSVSDTGTGIPGEKLEHVFDRFYQVESSYESKYKGTGIGLSIVKGLVELHHGTIDVKSRTGQETSGTEFRIQLPLGTGHLDPDEIVDPSQQPRQAGTPAAVDLFLGEDDDNTDESPQTKPDLHKKETVLVVEDSADVREYIRGALEPFFNVEEARDGERGLKKARKFIPDIIVSDIMMPGPDGFELCRILKSDIQTSHIPIILLTAKTSEEDILAGLETGADDFLAKPFNTKILVNRIKNLIRLRRHLQETFNRRMNLQPVEIPQSDIDKEFLNDLMDAINQNLPDPDFNVEDLSNKLYMSRTTLYRKVQALTGETPTDFIRSCRLKRAAELLQKNSGSILEIALEVGFSNSSYFTKCFKEKYHRLPSQYQGKKNQ